MHPAARPAPCVHSKLRLVNAYVCDGASHLCLQFFYTASHTAITCAVSSNTQTWEHKQACKATGSTGRTTFQLRLKRGQGGLCNNAAKLVLTTKQTHSTQIKRERTRGGHVLALFIRQLLQSLL